MVRRAPVFGILRSLGFVTLVGALASAVAQSSRPAEKNEITIDTSETPELKEWAERLRPTFEKWYPTIVDYLPSNGFVPPRKFSITFKNMRGIAYTSGDRIVCAAAW